MHSKNKCYEQVPKVVYRMLLNFSKKNEVENDLPWIDHSPTYQLVTSLLRESMLYMRIELMHIILLLSIGEDRHFTKINDN